MYSMCSNCIRVVIFGNLSGGNVEGEFPEEKMFTFLH